MAIYHFSVQVIGRSSGRSSVAAAAYRAGELLHDERLDRDHDFRAKAGIEHSEILLPANAPEQWRDRQRLWNDIEAFEKRRDAQLAREVEGLSAQKERTPDYSETLGQVVRHIAGVERTLAVLAKAPAMQLTPESFAVEMIQAAQEVRAEDAATIRHAAKGLASSAATIDRALESARTARDQKRVVLRAAGIAATVTLFVMLALPGIVYRALPDRWLTPERAAARVLRLDRWRAGERLLATADPDRWRAVVLADTIAHENRDTIMACRRVAAKAKEPVRCSVTIANPPPD